MSFDHEKGVAMHLLKALEDGTLPIDDLRPRYEEADPALVHMIFAWLRQRYRGHSAADGVYGRIVELCTASQKVARMAREGEKDAIVQWFEETFDYGDLDRDAFISLVVEKLEG